MTTATGTTAAVLTSSGIVAKAGGYGLSTVYRIPTDHAVLRVRTSITRDAYDAQSRYCADVWSAERGWMPVTTVEPLSEEGTAMPPYVYSKQIRDGKVPEAVAAACEEMEARLLSDALAVLL